LPEMWPLENNTPDSNTLAHRLFRLKKMLVMT